MLLRTRLVIGFSIIIHSQLGFGTQADNPSLELGSVLNDKGQPIRVPSETHSDFNYSPPTIEGSSPASTQINKSKKKPSKQAKAKSRKQQLASRSSVANNPSCRWLNSRMNSLEKHLSAGVNSRNRHYQQELDIRQQEWQCMKCGAEGPEQSDHASCQYRR
ncbi:hypothetical protein [Shewanella pealeana]|uniref:Uncharacterized protein n=1 Tax=Shewanella pealeana (strain ATCC 700345 / ANG-SQ1) TaxID=398579 RepID=A8H9Z0_SHEPA|nr:hypothetical protein [Shewanella pealeana]ABV89377.1 conserved hypothetical protein [Shewanella pealeana ATCC 700345]